MPAIPDPEPDRPRPLLLVGCDDAGHWLVQDETRRLEGHFVSRAAALRFAEAERHFYHADVRLLTTPLRPAVACGRAGAGA